MTTSSGQGRSDKSARWDKHIERLPEYAEKAREVIQTYRASKDVVPASASGVTGVSTDEATRKLQRQAKLAVRERVRLEGKRRHAAQSSVVWSIIAAVAFVLVVLNVVNVVAGSTVGAALVGVAATALAVRSGVKLRTLNAQELPSVPTPLALPPSGSSAREPVQRLILAQASLHELLTQLRQPAPGAVSVDADSVTHARRTAREAESTLASLAGRIVSLERAAAAAGDGQRSSLDASASQLRQQLDDGVATYGTLVAAAGQAVATSGTGIGAAQASITDAADHLAGMASALKELGA